MPAPVHKAARWKSELEYQSHHLPTPTPLPKKNKKKNKYSLEQDPNLPKNQVSNNQITSAGHEWKIHLTREYCGTSNLKIPHPL